MILDWLFYLRIHIFISNLGIANNISQEEQAIITNRENSIFPHGIIDPNESEDTPIDTDEIIEFHN